ncbi:hypothetical protein ACQPXH_04075 [Nocardia sp. CA-135953]|uniref:hypothetical protein n=1 Tax=Nocardia sp. CA-135953 TaxID=3239978 RepID=UPI003D95D714
MGARRFRRTRFGPANDRFPNPLRFTSRFAHRDDFEAGRVTMRERYSRDEFEEIQLALQTLTTPPCASKSSAAQPNTRILWVACGYPA